MFKDNFGYSRQQKSYKAYIMLVGRLGADPVVKMFGGTSVASFGLAVSMSKKVNGQWVDNTIWFNVSAWGEMSEIVTSFHKGDLVIIEGVPKPNSYTKKDGTLVNELSITLRTIEPAVAWEYEMSMKPNTHKLLGDTVARENTRKSIAEFEAEASETVDIPF